MSDKTVVITGATSGIGLETAALLAKEGFRVIGIGRSGERCHAARKYILEAAPEADVAYLTADLYHQREVLRVALEIHDILAEKGNGELFALINNAGCAQSYYTTSEDGIERQFALNYLAAFLLTHKLLPDLIKGRGRVIMTGSESHKGIRVHWDDIMLTHRYHPLTAYKQSKLCGMLLAKGLNDRYTGMGIRAFVVDPGLVKTNIGDKAGGIVKIVWHFRKPFGISPAVSAQTYGWICRQETHPAGLYYCKCQPCKYSREVTGQNADRLFQLSHRLCGTEQNSEVAQ